MKTQKNLFEAEEFLVYLHNWYKALPTLAINVITSQPERTAFCAVDLTVGFCQTGALASERVGKIAEPAITLMKRLWDQGVRDFLLSKDTHQPDALEFSSWPVHCVRGSTETEPLDALQKLPFYNQIQILEKNSLSSSLNTGLKTWLNEHSIINTFIVVGDCTDLCVYQLAMHLRMDANARQIMRRIIVPANLVETYDRSVAAVESEGGFPHPGDLLHVIFLYHLALSGVEVVSAIQ